VEKKMGEKVYSIDYFKESFSKRRKVHLFKIFLSLEESFLSQVQKSAIQSLFLHIHTNFFYIFQ